MLGSHRLPPADAVRIACNGTPVTASQWLRDGDVLRLGPSQLVVAASGEEMRFVVREAEAESEAKAPVVLVPPPREALIHPIEFKPGRSLESTRKRRRLKLGTVLAGLFLAGLAGAATFVFTARSVLVEIEPAPDRMTITGSM